MPYTKKELLKNPFWQKLHEQDRVDYENKLQHALKFQRATTMVDDEGNVINIEENKKNKPLRNEAGTFLAFENPDTGLNYERPDQFIAVDKKSPMYYKGDLWNKVLDREIKELV